MISSKKFNDKGTMLFVLNGNFDLLTATKNVEDELEKYSDEVKKEFYERYHTHEIYDMYSGKEFIEMVENGCIIDNDGTLVNVFVDGYNSNLGLYNNNFHQGEFLVTKDMFLCVCKEYDVLVNWANK